MTSSSDLARLIRAAARGGPSSRAALAVLQDALLERFGRAFEESVALARSVDTGTFAAERFVVFYPHAISRGETVARIGRSPIPGDFPPFGIATSPQLLYSVHEGARTATPAPGVVVWSSRAGPDTSAQQKVWRDAQRELVRARQARPAMVLDVERIRLDRGGYSTRNGIYYGVGQPVFRVFSQEPLPENEAGWIAPHSPHVYRVTDGVWVDSVLRAANVREARERVARALGVRGLAPRTRRTT